MRIAVMGAGAVGGYFGAKLAAAGHDLVFIARGSHLAALRSGGLRVMHRDSELLIHNALFTDDPSTAGPADLVLLCVKSYDTEAALDAMPPLVREGAAILSLQNGVDNADKIARRFGDRRVLAGVVYVGAQIVAPGVVEHSSGGKIIFGPAAGPRHEAADQVRQALALAGIPYEIKAAIQEAQWRKLLWNASFCAIGSLTRATVKDILESESLIRLATECMEEVRLAAATRNVVLSKRLVAETISFSRTLGTFKPSMLQDLEAGKPLEYEAFNGVVVQTLGSAGHDAPVNRVFYGALKYLDNKIRKEASRNEHAPQS